MFSVIIFFTWFFSVLLTARIYFCCQSTVFISLVLLVIIANIDMST
jgi:hypothetical protein